MKDILWKIVWVGCGWIFDGFFCSWGNFFGKRKGVKENGAPPFEGVFCCMIQVALGIPVPRNWCELLGGDWTLRSCELTNCVPLELSFHTTSKPLKSQFLSKCPGKRDMIYLLFFPFHSNLH